MIGFATIGSFFAIDKLSYENFIKIVLFALSTFTLFAAIYSYNSFGGLKDDILNKRFGYLNLNQKTFFKITFIIFLMCALIIYMYLSKYIALMGLISFILWLLYSAPGIGLKRFPFIGTIIHFITQIIHFQMGYIVFLPLSYNSLYFSVYFALLFAGGHLHHEIIDYKADNDAGIKTTAVSFGVRNSFLLYYITFISSGVYLIFIQQIGIITIYESIPFLVALVLQLITTYIFCRKNYTNDFLIRNRTCYRLYYFIATSSYIVVKLKLI